MPYKDPEVRKEKARERRKKKRKEYREKQYRWRRENPERWEKIQKDSLERRKADGRIKTNEKNYYRNNAERVKARVRKARIDRYEKYLVSRISKKAEKLGIPFNLTPEDVLIPTHCPVLGMPLDKESPGQSDDKPSLDRLSPELGYVKGNVKVISMKANRIKNNASVEDLEKVLIYMRGVRDGCCR